MGGRTSAFDILRSFLIFLYASTSYYRNLMTSLLTCSCTPVSQMMLDSYFVEDNAPQQYLRAKLHFPDDNTNEPSSVCCLDVSMY